MQIVQILDKAKSNCRFFGSKIHCSTPTCSPLRVYFFHREWLPASSPSELVLERYPFSASPAVNPEPSIVSRLGILVILENELERDGDSEVCWPVWSARSRQQTSVPEGRKMGMSTECSDVPREQWKGDFSTWIGIRRGHLEGTAAGADLGTDLGDGRRQSWWRTSIADPVCFEGRLCCSFPRCPGDVLRWRKPMEGGALRVRLRPTSAKPARRSTMGRFHRRASISLLLRRKGLNFDSSSGHRSREA